ncbi:protein FAM43A-like [Astyanax mexicanus]|uniref:Protein FAM43A-like n=1 Tax=Astyanax mexicanus TaxID=7994 RepID=A0A8T2LVF5_ASTMX|nr:protein FAM43A-like [Astyanax mexicanus]
MPSGAEPCEEKYSKRCVSWAKAYRDRIGGILPSTRKTLSISTDDPSFPVLYLGSSTTLQAKGSGCTDAAVSKVWRKSDMGRTGSRMLLTVGAQGIRMEHSGEKRTERKPDHLYLLHRVTHCATDPALPRVLAWVYRHQVKNKAVMLRCHVALLPKADQARTAENLLNRTLLTALTEFQRLKRRQDAKRQQMLQAGPGTVPLLPIRKLLNGQCCYKPPAQNSASHSGQKLCSISEDSLGEEEEERSSYLDEECLEDEEDEEEMYLIINNLQQLDLQNEMTCLCGQSMSSQSSGETSDEDALLPAC